MMGRSSCLLAVALMNATLGSLAGTLVSCCCRLQSGTDRRDLAHFALIAADFRDRATAAAIRRPACSEKLEFAANCAQRVSCTRPGVLHGALRVNSFELPDNEIGRRIAALSTFSRRISRPMT